MYDKINVMTPGPGAYALPLLPTSLTDEGMGCFQLVAKGSLDALHVDHLVAVPQVAVGGLFQRA